MKYLAKDTLLWAYKKLSTLSEDPSLQGATQKISAIRYALALDMFYKQNNRECDTRDSKDKAEFANYINRIVAISDKLYTPNFYIPLASHLGDCAVGSNFYSVGAVKNSLMNPSLIISYPQRGNKPLFEIQNGKLYRRSEMVSNINSYIPLDEHKFALALWIIGKSELESSNILLEIDRIYHSMFTKELCDFLLPTDSSEDSFCEINFDDQLAVLNKNDIENLFEEKRLIMKHSEGSQIIYFGAPGTGKSHKVREIIGEETNLPNVFRTTFHPDTDYASFVGCYKPSMRPTTSAEKTLTGKDEEIVYTFVPQVFTDAYVYAYKHPAETTYLVLEEINRGNCAQIFGDLFQLLDRKDGVSEYKIKADNDLAKYLVAQFGEESEGIKDGKLCLPANLSILATMNTSDQSLFPMDSAFKRRWEWEYVPINYSADILSGSFDITIGEKVYSWVEFIQSVNKHIFDLTQSEDKQMGNFFIKHSVDESEFKSKVMFYLWYEVLRDETGNNKYFFRQNTPDGKDSTPFTFKDLYETDAQETIQQFMAYLGVAPK